MDRTEFSEHLGEKIRQIRHKRGFSSEQLADRLSHQGVIMSGRAVRNYENGDRELSVELLIQIAIALDCSVQTLIDGLDPRSGVDTDRSTTEFNILTPEEHKVFRYMATDWAGDIHALIIMNALYMALPPKYRREAPLSLLAQAELALQDGAINREQLPEGLEYMEQKWRSLYR